LIEHRDARFGSAPPGTDRDYPEATCASRDVRRLAICIGAIDCRTPAPGARGFIEPAIRADRCRPDISNPLAHGNQVLE
jgi:hypothetical protein